MYAKPRKEKKENVAVSARLLNSVNWGCMDVVIIQLNKPLPVLSTFCLVKYFEFDEGLLCSSKTVLCLIKTFIGALTLLMMTLKFFSSILIF